MDKGNTVSGTLSATQLGEMTQEIRKIQESIPGVIALTLEDKQRLVKPGDSGLAAAEVALGVLEKHPELFPSAIFNVAEFKSDLTLADQMKKLGAEVRSLQSVIDDTGMAAASDAYRTALRIYAMATRMVDIVPGLAADIAKFEEHVDRTGAKPTAGSTTQSAG